MSQLSLAHANQLWPSKSNRIFFLNHSYSEEDCLARMLKSVQPLTSNIVVLIDDRTTDNTEQIANDHGAFTATFKWHHSFSYAKNLCLKVAMDHCDLQFGDWVLWMGADFELQPHAVPEIKDFVSCPTNFFAQFWVPEYAPPVSRQGLFGRLASAIGLRPKTPKVVTRLRKLLWRHHPMIYWERSVHEEAVFSAYRLTGQGIPFGDLEWKKFPILGGSNGMMHYGFHEDGGEEGDVFWRKKAYYLILTQIDRVRLRYNLPETPEGMLEALRYIYNNPGIEDIDTAVNSLLERYMSGDLPKGLAEHFSREWMLTCLDKEYSE